MATTFECTLPCGKIETRTSENREYTHAVATRANYEDALQNAKTITAGMRESYRFHVREANPATNKYGEDYLQKSAAALAGVKDEEEYLAREVAEAVAKVEEAKVLGRYDTYSVHCWCGRLDLAQKQLSSVRYKPWIADAQIVPVRVVEKPKRVKKAKPAEAKPAEVKPVEVKPVEVNPTKAMYDSLYAAYDHFNAALFEGSLPAVMLVIHRKRMVHGYFWNEQWAGKDGGTKLAEIALNPETMGRSIREVLSTLVHEMVHFEQQVYGTPGKAISHNKEWADWMDRVGLTPKGVGRDAGKRTGRTVSHEIVDGGPYDVAFKELTARADVDFSWFAVRHVAMGRGRDRSKVKHTCPECGANVWGKEGINVYCGCSGSKMGEA